jgi:hypothetical protein
MSKGGFTEAERAAFQYSKLLKEKSSNSAAIKPSSSTSLLSTNSWDRYRPKGRSKSPIRSKTKRYSPEHDEFGRDRPSYSPYRGNDDDIPERTQVQGRYEPPRKEPQRYRSRSRSYEHDRDRDRDRERTRDDDRYGADRSRSRSRSKSPVDLAKLPPPPDPVPRFHDDRLWARGSVRAERSEGVRRSGYASRSDYQARSSSRERQRPVHHRDETDSKQDFAWKHDRHIEDEPDLIPIPKDYRPPSPTWKSRAGGVYLRTK